MEEVTKLALSESLGPGAGAAQRLSFREPERLAGQQGTMQLKFPPRLD